MRRWQVSHTLDLYPLGYFFLKRRGRVQVMSTAAGSGVEVVALDTPALGDRSYLAHDGEVALVIDPQRDIDRVLALAAARGVRITHVFETHLHNDYVTGGLALASATGAAYHVNAADEVAFDRVPAAGGDLIEVSPVMRVRVLATPGHTFTHLSCVLQAAGHAHAVFTGGSLLYGSTGRPDLLGRVRPGRPRGPADSRSPGAGGGGPLSVSEPGGPTS